MKSTLDKSRLIWIQNDISHILNTTKVLVYEIKAIDGTMYYSKNKLFNTVLTYHRHWAIIWISDESVLLIRPLETNFCEIWNIKQSSSYNKRQLKIHSAPPEVKGKTMNTGKCMCGWNKRSLTWSCTVLTCILVGSVLWCCRGITNGIEKWQNGRLRNHCGLSWGAFQKHLRALRSKSS